MEFRGIWQSMSSRSKRALTVSWTALFVLSLLLQYFAMAAPGSALAVHDEQFQLDGNAVDDPGNPPDDWANHPGSDAFVFITDPLDAQDDDIFTGGGSKDINDTDEWAWTTGSVPDKDNIEHAYAALYDDIIYYGLDRFANNGDAQVGFWFFKNGLSVNADGSFSPNHAIGDLLVVSHFTNGGAVSTIELYEWVGSGGSDGTLDLLGSGVVCTGAPVDDQACAIANTDDETAPWDYTPKFGDEGVFPPGSFFEGGLDLNSVFDGQPPCFSSFLVETRSSQEVEAQLKDFASGDFNTCVPPEIETEVSDATIDLGGSVTDTATLSGNDGPASGTVDFFVCGPTGAPADCAGGTQVGGSVDVDTSANGGTATSDAFTPTEGGFYCFRVHYTPDADSQYLEASHTNDSSECFQVLEADVNVVKVANPAGPVSAGDEVGFDITVSNDGDGTATDVVLTDDLPAGVDWALGAISGDTEGVDCDLSGAVGSETLECTDDSMGAGASFSVHVSGTTDATDCGTIENTASVDSGNDGEGESTASVDVLCPDVTVEKTPDGDIVNAGGTATFTIEVTNLGPGVAHDVTLTDDLPAGIDWSEDSASCTISGAVDSQVLDCDFGDLAAEQSVTVHVSGAVDDDDCGDLPNTASVSASNEPEDATDNNSDDGLIDVTCAQIGVTKTADDDVVSAGNQIGFVVTITNNGDGQADGLDFVDDLPGGPGIDWEIESSSSGWSIAGSPPNEQLVYAPTTLALGASTSVHVVSDTTQDSCATYDNTATVTTVNDGSDEANASTEVVCSVLAIAKSFTGNTGGTDPDLGVPLAKIGDTLHYTLNYVGSGPITNAVITDVLPVGLDYVEGSATGDTNFAFVGLDDATRTLTWAAAADVTLDSPSGSVTYDVVVLAAAAEEVQPIDNVATIDSDETGPDDDTKSVAVAPAPLELTPPPTDALAPSAPASNPGFALMLTLLAIGGLVLVIGFVTPVPERANRRNRRG
jgi:uncharacterized repeat protein (TIGR01451 family)